MKRRLFLFLFIASLLLVLGTIAAACNDDGDDESDEDAIRNVLQEHVAAVNDRDFDRVGETITANFEAGSRYRAFEANPNFRLGDLEILSVTVAGDEATAMITHDLGSDTLLLIREDGRWLIDR